ncbi:hypothetical protein EB796_009439 [Bugula neritina]|uniref:Uncharacterized protein n=1 Tax=Bugula neritina TaxID=10212 RepID=A0A7J7K248_BUGNE|nr:hypothetical protein EB796_009439 [Bugula neritina]
MSHFIRYIVVAALTAALNLHLAVILVGGCGVYSCHCFCPSQCLCYTRLCNRCLSYIHYSGQLLFVLREAFKKRAQLCPSQTCLTCPPQTCLTCLPQTCLTCLPQTCVTCSKW